MRPPDDTIVALSTPPGRGAIGLIRLSGPEALPIATRVFRVSPSARISPRRATLGTLVRPDDGEEIDKGYLTYFRAGRSYTGEDVVEITTHGSPVVLERVLEEILAAGARAAGPGEFTYRALLNGRIDLPQAEGVRDLIDAATPHAARVARDQIRGDLSRRIGGIRESLEEIICRAEAAVEFAEEPDVAGGVDRDPIAARIDALCGSIDAFLATYRKGRLLREGARVVLAGQPNAGKSSLFNRLLDRDRALVAPQPGTTRDWIAERIDVGGIPVTLVDTAGLREADESIEAAGVRMTRGLLDEADLVVLLVACDSGSTPEDRAIAESLGDRALVVGSKADLADGGPPAVNGHVPLPVSALTGQGIRDLRDRIASCLAGTSDLSHGEVILSNARHHAALDGCRRRVEAARAALAAGASEEIPLVDLYAALRHLEEITGSIPMDAIYDRIFSSFCIGK